MYCVWPETCHHSESPGWCDQLRTAPTVGFHLALQCISTELLSDDLWSDPLPVFILISVFSFQSATCPFHPVGSIACALLETKRRDHVDSAYFLTLCKKKIKRKNSSHPWYFICLWHTSMGGWCHLMIEMLQSHWGCHWSQWPISVGQDTFEEDPDNLQIWSDWSDHYCPLQCSDLCRPVLFVIWLLECMFVSDLNRTKEK